jgi:hypothetical protein
LVPAVGYEIGQRRVCCLMISANVLREREFEAAIAFIWLELSFAQGHLAVATRDSDDHLPSMTVSSGRLQLRLWRRRRYHWDLPAVKWTKFGAG